MVRLCIPSCLLTVPSRDGVMAGFLKDPKERHRRRAMVQQRVQTFMGQVCTSITVARRGDGQVKLLLVYGKGGLICNV